MSETEQAPASGGVDEYCPVCGSAQALTECPELATDPPGESDGTLCSRCNGTGEVLACPTCLTHELTALRARVEAAERDTARLREVRMVAMRDVVATSIREQAQRTRAEQAEERAERLREALTIIARGEGRYSRDPLTHASNTIEDMVQVATAALTPSPTPTRTEP